MARVPAKNCHVGLAGSTGDSGQIARSSHADNYSAWMWVQFTWLFEHLCFLDNRACSSIDYAGMAWLIAHYTETLQGSRTGHDHSSHFVWGEKRQTFRNTDIKKWNLVQVNHALKKAVHYHSLQEQTRWEGLDLPRKLSWMSGMHIGILQWRSLAYQRERPFPPFHVYITNPQEYPRK